MMSVLTHSSNHQEFIREIMKDDTQTMDELTAKLREYVKAKSAFINPEGKLAEILKILDIEINVQENSASLTLNSNGSVI